MTPQLDLPATLPDYDPDAHGARSVLCLALRLAQLTFVPCEPCTGLDCAPCIGWTVLPTGARPTRRRLDPAEVMSPRLHAALFSLSLTLKGRDLQHLKRYLVAALATHDDGKDVMRDWAVADWAVRRALPRALRLAGTPRQAQAFSLLPPLQPRAVYVHAVLDEALTPWKRRWRPILAYAIRAHLAHHAPDRHIAHTLLTRKVQAHLTYLEDAQVEPSPPTEPPNLATLLAWALNRSPRPFHVALLAPELAAAADVATATTPEPAAIINHAIVLAFLATAIALIGRTIADALLDQPHRPAADRARFAIIDAAERPLHATAHAPNLHGALELLDLLIEPSPAPDDRAA